MEYWVYVWEFYCVVYVEGLQECKDWALVWKRKGSSSSNAKRNGDNKKNKR